MGMASSLILVANPGSASRKYALYDGAKPRAIIHFEWVEGSIVCTLKQGDQNQNVGTNLHDLQATTESVKAIFTAAGVLEEHENISAIGLRIVAPGQYFQEDHPVDDDFLKQLNKVASGAPLHITATLQEVTALSKSFPDTPIFGISDSRFHADKPKKAQYYGLPLDDAKKNAIQRFGYHGISLASVIRTVRDSGASEPRIIVCHLGSGVSVTAVHGETALDTTMGYSPLEGTIMSTRSGSLDVSAALQVKKMHGLNDSELDDYLHHKSGLLGLGGSDDVRELLEREKHGDERAAFALEVYVYAIQKAIGQMAAVTGGADILVFTGTIGERSAPVRERVVDGLEYLYFRIDCQHNNTTFEPRDVANVAEVHSQPILVVGADEAQEISRRTTEALSRTA